MSENRPQPLILAFVSDLMFTTKIGNVARHLNYRVQWIEGADMFGEANQEFSTEGLGEKLQGLEGALFVKITIWQPGLMIFDLANQAVPWQRWIPALKSSPATRRIPIITFGPHTNVELMNSAKAAGADQVLARSRFTSDMPQLLEKYMRLPDHEAISGECQQPLSSLAIEGVLKFNQGEYYACHDFLEEAWMEDQTAGRDLYRGMLQVGIAYYQIERGNYRGALKMLLRVRQWLNPLPAICKGVDVASLRADISNVQQVLKDLGPEHIQAFDRNLFRPIKFDL